MKLLIFGIDLILPLIVGYCCQYQKKFNDQFFNKMILNNILVVYPALSFLCFWILPLNFDLIWLPVMGLAMGLIPGLVAYFVAEKKFADDLDRGSYVMSAVLSNLGTLGGLCVFLLYGERGYGYQQLVVLFQYILMFMFCYPLAQYYYQRANSEGAITKISVTQVLFSRNQLAVVGIFCGVALQLAGIPRPHALDGMAEFFVHFGAWTALIPVGYSMDFAKMKGYYYQLKELIAIKFIVTPVAIYGLSHLIMTDRVMLNSILILASTPTAVNAVITSRIYDLNINIAVAAFIVTTLIFLTIIYPGLFIMLQ